MRARDANDIALGASFEYLGSLLSADDDARDLTFRTDKRTDQLLDFFSQFYQVEKALVIAGMLGGTVNHALQAQELSRDFANYLDDQDKKEDETDNG